MREKSIGLSELSHWPHNDLKNGKYWLLKYFASFSVINYKKLRAEFFLSLRWTVFFIRAKKIPDRFDPVKWYPHGDHKLGSRQVHVGNHLGARVLHLQNHVQVHVGNHLGAGVLHLQNHDQVHNGNHLGAGVLHLQNHDQVHNGNHLGAGVLHLRKHDEVHVGNHLGARVLHLQNHDHDLGAGVLRGVYSY